MSVIPLVLTINDIRSSGRTMPDIKISCHINNENNYSVCILNTWLAVSDNNGIYWAEGALLHTLNSQSEPALIKGGDEGLAEISLQLPIPTLRTIEEFRKGDDLELVISSRILVSKIINGSQGFLTGAPFETKLVSKNSAQFKYGIPKSKWINLYNTFGLNQIELIEINFNAGQDNEDFKRALDRLSDAKKAFLQGDYEHVLFSCRKLQEAFVQDSNQKEGMKEASLAIEKILGAGKKADAMNDIIKKIGSFLHLGRHESHPPIVINRKDAEFAIQLNSALLSYLMRYNA